MSEKKYEVEFRGGQFWAVLPMVIFLVFCVVYFVIFKVFDMNALAVGGFVGLLVGALFCKNYGAYWNAVLRGIGSTTSVSIVVILLVIGMFTKLMAASGVSQGFVWVAHMIGMKGSVFTAFTFLASCLITSATGSSIGTLSTVFPILYPAGVLLGSNPAILAGAILSGAIFGDNLAPISDVTIASPTSQRFRTKEGNADIAGTVGYRLKYALIAGAISLVIFAILGGGGTSAAGADDILQANMNPMGLIMLIPVALLLFVSIRTQDIFKAVTAGLISGIVVGLLCGAFQPSDILGIQDGNATGFIYNGFTGMIGICLFCMALFGAMGVLNESGTMERVIQDQHRAPGRRHQRLRAHLRACGRRAGRPAPDPPLSPGQLPHRLRQQLPRYHPLYQRLCLYLCVCDRAHGGGVFLPALRYAHPDLQRRLLSHGALCGPHRFHPHRMGPEV